MKLDVKGAVRFGTNDLPSFDFKISSLSLTATTSPG